MTKNQKITAALAAAILVAGLGSAYWFWWPIHRAESMVLKRLIDPDSAKFDEVTVNRSTGAVCGFVNSKNKFGGYTGNTLFGVSKNGEVHIDRGDPQSVGTAEMNISALNEHIAMLEFFIANCPK